MNTSVLILGANGRFGRHAAEAFWNAGWQVRIFDRNTEKLNDAAQGVDVIVNGWNPPYPDWQRDVPRLTNRVIAAAKASNATVILPGNVYVYGKDADAVYRTDSPHAATNPLGRIRIEMEAAYRDAGVQTIVLRAGDFIDTQASGNWFDEVIATKVKKGIVVSPGDPTVAHAWAFLPDLARAAVCLAERRESLGQFEDIPFPGYTLSIAELADLIATSTGKLQRVRRFLWLPVQIAAPFWKMGRSLLEMRYLWSKPHSLDDQRFTELLPEFRPTDPLTAIGQALAHLDVDPNQPVARGKGYVPAE